MLAVEQRLDQLKRHNNRLSATPTLLPVALCAVLTLAGLPTAIQAQNDNTQSIGFVVGSTHGIGFSYARQNNQSGIGWQVTGIPFMGAGETFLSGAGSLFKTLTQGKIGRAFLSFGVTARYYECSICLDDNGNGEETYGLVFGPGVGLERLYAENFAISLEIPIAIHIFSDKAFKILPIPNFSLAYRW